MLRATFLVVATLASTAAYAQDARTDRYQVDVERLSADTLRIHFQTNEIMNEMCALDVVDARVSAGAFDAQGRVRSGLIRLDTMPQDICLQALGPWQGATDLHLGEQLPELAAGRYQLVIDGSVEGRLVVSEEGRVRFVEANRDEQLPAE